MLPHQLVEVYKFKLFQPRNHPITTAQTLVNSNATACTDIKVFATVKGISFYDSFSQTIAQTIANSMATLYLIY